jgi:hypothetical protein
MIGSQAHVGERLVEGLRVRSEEDEDRLVRAWAKGSSRACAGGSQ